MGYSEGRRPEESGVRAFQKQDQILHSVQNDNQNQVLLDAQDGNRSCHSEAGFMAEESGVGFLRKSKNEILRIRSE